MMSRPGDLSSGTSNRRANVLLAVSLFAAGVLTKSTVDFGLSFTERRHTEDTQRLRDANLTLVQQLEALADVHLPRATTRLDTEPPVPGLDAWSNFDNRFVSIVNGDPLSRYETVVTLRRLARVSLLQGNTALANDFLGEAIDKIGELKAEHPATISYYFDESEIRLLRAHVYLQMRLFTKVRVECDAIRSTANKYTDAGSGEFKLLAVETLLGCAAVLRLVGDQAEAHETLVLAKQMLLGSTSALIGEEERDRVEREIDKILKGDR
ncbi:MAG TPA: hypothetical protein DDW52_23480 [Planctomycetaceae bacterium]|nr:hypothetical protein [Planctomycetaceae bacterium]